MREIVIPGEKIDPNISGGYKEGKNNYSMIFGLLDKKALKIIPLSGKYIPNIGDYVVGIILDVKFGGCIVDINCPYTAFLPTQRSYDYKDVIFAKVFNVDEVKSVTLSNERKLFGGDIIEISPVRVSRIIGTKNSMIDLIKEKTKTNILVGRNGRIWLKEGDVIKAEKAILKIEEEAHTHGLTDRIKEFLEK